MAHVPIKNFVSNQQGPEHFQGSVYTHCCCMWEKVIDLFKPKPTVFIHIQNAQAQGDFPIARLQEGSQVRISPP